jgi:acetyl esterase/lipase/streptogramin lyase
MSARRPSAAIALATILVGLLPPPSGLAADPSPPAAAFPVEGTLPDASISVRTHVGPGASGPVFDGARLWISDEIGVRAVDPDTGEVVVQASIGPGASVGAADGLVWIGSYGNDLVAPIDPKSGEVDRSRAVRVTGPGAMLLAHDSLWVFSVAAQTLLRLDATSGEIQAAVPVESWGFLAAGPDAVWVSSEPAGGLVRIDAASNLAVPIDLDLPVPTAVVASGDAVWVASLGGQLRRYDPITREVVEGAVFLTRPTFEPTVGLALVGESLWATGVSAWDTWPDVISRPGFVARLDPLTLETLDAWASPAGVTGAASASGELWTTLGYSTLVSVPTDGVARGIESGPLPDAPGLVTWQEGLTYGTAPDGRDLPFDVYVPPDDPNAPIVLLVPGGPLPFENRHYLGSVAARLASDGLVAATMDYRSSATGDPVGAALEDVACAIGALRDVRARRAPTPTQPVVVAGHSFGSDLALQAALASDDAVSCQGHPHRPDAVVAVAGWVANVPNEPTVRRPIHLVTGDQDSAASTIGRVGDSLREAGYDVTVTILPGADHGSVLDIRRGNRTIAIIEEAARGASAAG